MINKNLVIVIGALIILAAITVLALRVTQRPIRLAPGYTTETQ